MREVTEKEMLVVDRVNKELLTRTCALFTFIALGAACNSLEIPEGPELSQLAAVYEEPDGALPQEELGLIIETTQEALLVLEQVDKLDFFVKTLEGVAKAIADVATRDDGGVLGITGVTEVHSLCPGFEGSTTNDKGTGSLSFTVTIEDSTLDEVIWGDFDECQSTIEGFDVTFNSTIEIFLGEEVHLSSLHFPSLLFRLVGEYTVNGRTLDLDFDFRVLRERVEFRIPAEDGDVIFQVGNNLGELGVRTREGSFCCVLAERTCYLLDGVECNSERSGQEITW